MGITNIEAGGGVDAVADMGGKAAAKMGNDGQKSWRFWCKSFWKLFLKLMGKWDMESRSSSKIISSLLLQKTKNQNQNNPTYLTKILTFDQLYLVQKKKKRKTQLHTTTMFLMLVLSFVCLFVCLTQIYSLKSQKK